jgi:nucleotidyltransferase/DNA polymerase involved in DNA repair
MHPWDEETLESLARSLAGRVGVAPRRFSARMGALQAGIGSVRHVQPEGVRAFLEKTSVRNLKEVGFELDLIERLELFGLYTLGRVARLESRHLKAQFGETGERLHRLLHPEEEEPPIPLFQPPPSVSADYDFEFPSAEPAELLPVLDHLLEEAIVRLGERRAQLLTIRLQGSGEDGVRLMRRVLKSPTARFAHLRVIAGRLLDDMVDGEAPVDTMTLELGGLARPGVMQGGLFSDRPAVYESVRALHQRFPGRIFRAVITDAEAYLPEDGVKLEPYPVEPGRRRK